MSPISKNWQDLIKPSKLQVESGDDPTFKLDSR